MGELFTHMWGYFWSLFPKNYLFLVIMSAVCEVTSVVLFKLSSNRGVLTFIGYILGFFVVAFYAEALKYSRVTQSYPVWLVIVAVFLVATSTLILREKVSMLWVVGFVLTIAGVLIIQLSLPPET